MCLQLLHLTDQSVDAPRKDFSAPFVVNSRITDQNALNIVQIVYFVVSEDLLRNFATFTRPNHLTHAICNGLGLLSHNWMPSVVL